MHRRLTWPLLFSSTIVITALYHPGIARATPAEGYKSTVVAVGRFGEIDASNFFPLGMKLEGNEQRSRSLQETKGLSDVYVQSNVWAPGGSTGWHSHPGHSLIIVTAGTVTDYEGHDPNCKPHVYTKGMTFTDPGGEHAHIIRNESNVVARTTAVQFIPAGAERRIDIADPGNCHF
jgi:quercetin dioxygenase-like cupin family protein